MGGVYFSNMTYRNITTANWENSIISTIAIVRASSTLVNFTFEDMSLGLG